MKKNKVIKNLVVCAGASAIIGGTFGGLALYDSHIDHTEEICPFTHILGIEHQIEKIQEKEKYLHVFTDSTMIYNKHEISYMTVRVPYYEYNGFDYVEEVGLMAPKYEKTYKLEVVRDDKFTPCTISASKDEIVFVDPNKAEIVKALKLK